MNFESITKHVIAAVKEAGDFIRRERAVFVISSAERKAKNDLVSYVDKESERMLTQSLGAVFPDAGFIAEEESGRPAAEWNWIIDPLDGTTNFVHGIPCYCVSVALAQHKQIKVAVVLEVSGNECFYTWENAPAYLNGKEIKCSRVKSPADALIALGFPVNNFDHLPAYLKAVEYFVQNTHGIRRIGSAAADLCFLACGRADAFFEYNLKPWDVAAGALIAQNAGARVQDFSGKDNWLFGREIMVSGPNFFPEFSGLIQKFFQKE